jgi:hypothetical protein
MTFQKYQSYYVDFVQQPLLETSILFANKQASVFFCCRG